MDHPEKLYPIIGILVFLLIVLYMRNLGARKVGAGTTYLGSAVHQTSMADIIEDVSRRIVTAYPTLDDAEQVRMVRDELKLRGMAKVDLYEATIYLTIGRLKGGSVTRPLE